MRKLGNKTLGKSSFLLSPLLSLLRLNERAQVVGKLSLTLSLFLRPLSFFSLPSGVSESFPFYSGISLSAFSRTLHLEFWGFFLYKKARSVRRLQSPLSQFFMWQNRGIKRQKSWILPGSTSPPPPREKVPCHQITPKKGLLPEPETWFCLRVLLMSWQITVCKEKDHIWLALSTVSDFKKEESTLYRCRSRQETIEIENYKSERKLRVENEEEKTRVDFRCLKPE